MIPRIRKPQKINISEVFIFAKNIQFFVFVHYLSIVQYFSIDFYILIYLSEYEKPQKQHSLSSLTQSLFVFHPVHVLS